MPLNDPVPSVAADVLEYNAKRFDEVLTSDSETYTDRLGRVRLTVNGAIADGVSRFNAAINQLESDGEVAIQALRVVNAGSFEDGGTLTARNEALLYEAEKTFYRWDGALPKTVPAGSTPATTGGVGDDAWVNVGQAELASALTNPAESGNRVARMPITADSLKDLANAPRIANRQYSVKGFYAGADVGGGNFYWDPNRSKADHNGGTVIDPDRIVAWDGTQGDLATLFQMAIVVGSGCFVRINTGGSKEIDLSAFGVSGGNTPEYNSLAVSQAINKTKYEKFILSQRISMLGNGVIVDRPLDYVAVKSEGGGFIDITDGPAAPAFLVNRCRTFIVDNILFNEGKDPLVGSPGCVVGVLDTEKITTVRVTNNLLNHCRAFIGTSFSGYTSETIAGLGVKNLIIEGNEITNAYKNMMGRLIRIVDMPYDLFSFSNNKIGHFHGELVSAVNDNIGYSHLQKLFRCENNHIEWDDDFIIPDDGSFESFTYLTPYLVRCDKVIHKNNYQYGVKTHQLVGCYESYYGARILEASDNKYINCFTTQPRPLTGQLMKCKGGPVDEERNITYKHNHYLVERDYLTRIGISEGSVSHALFQLTDGSNPSVTSIKSKLIVEDNVIDVINIDGSYTERLPKSFKFNRNSIRFGGTVGNNPNSLQPMTFGAYTELVEVLNNTVECINPPLNYVLFSIGSGSASDNVAIAGNNIIGSSDASPMRLLRARENLNFSHHGDGSRFAGAVSLESVINSKHRIKSDAIAFDDTVLGRIYVPAQRESGIYESSYIGRTQDTSIVDTMRVYIGSDQELVVGDLIRVRQEWSLSTYSETPSGNNGKVSYEFVIRCVDDGGVPRNKIILLDATDVVREYFLDTTDGDGTSLKIDTTGNPPWTSLKFNSIDKTLDFSPTVSVTGGIFSVKSECVKTSLGN